jgi:hypothetical protein
MEDILIEQQVQDAAENYEQKETQEQIQDTEQQRSQDHQKKESIQAKNFRELREKAEAIQRERDEALRRLQEYEAQLKQQAPHASQEEDDELNIAPDELAEGKHLSKVGRKIKKLEQQLQQYQQSAQEAAIEARIKSQFPDFDNVVTKENIEALRLLEPEFAETLNASSNLYAKAVSAYKMIKKAGIIQEDTYTYDKQRALKNTTKPRPLASVSPQQGESPLQRANAFANGLTDELKSQLLREMMEARKGY